MINIYHNNEYITIPNEIKNYSEFFNNNLCDDNEPYLLFYGTQKDITLCIEYLNISNKTMFEINKETNLPIIPNISIKDFLSKEELLWLESISNIDYESLMIFCDYIVFDNLLYLLCYYYVNKKYL
jgi:hypothetical protein